ncbi:MAG: metallophosphoesterase [Candidatus Omnitrophica bacterium]|nr:metallophosphoesterase [Candidatus Omnitrophota bacterium]
MSPLFLVSLFFFAGLLFWMFLCEPRFYEISRHNISIHKKLARPIRIMHLSDIHFAGPNPPLTRFFDRLSREKIDFVFITGDIIDCPEGVPFAIEHIRKLKPSSGMFVVFGNHDYYNYTLLDFFLHNFPGQPHPKNLNPAAKLQKELKKIGAEVLRNKTVEVDFFGTPLLIHGLDDATTAHANIRQAMENFNRNKINLLLTHTVDVFLDIGENEIDLSFSGHSHGGQIRFPVVGPIITHTMMGRSYAGGIKKVQGAICSISRGMGAGRYVVLRLLCRPEAIILNVSGGGVQNA